MPVLTTPIELETSFIMDFWKPWPRREEPWGWSDEMQFYRDHGELHSVAEDVLRSGFDLVVLGGEGWVHSNGHVIIAAYMKGVPRLNCSLLLVR